MVHRPELTPRNKLLTTKPRREVHTNLLRALSPLLFADQPPSGTDDEGERRRGYPKGRKRGKFSQQHRDNMSEAAKRRDPSTRKLPKSVGWPRGKSRINPVTGEQIGGWPRGKKKGPKDPDEIARREETKKRTGRRGGWPKGKPRKQNPPQEQ